MKIAAFVPAKGASERIHNKNLAVLDGEYLFKRKLRQLLDCPEIDEIFLDTDSEELRSLSSDLPVKQLFRPAHLASNATDGHQLFTWECGQVAADIYIQALCTAPFIDSTTITRALKALLESPEHDSLVAVTNAKQYLWADGKPQYGTDSIPNSIDLPETIIEAMALYIVRAPIKNGKRFGTKPLLFPLSPTEATDVNWPTDLQLAETIAAGVRAQENLQLGALAPYLHTSMISDITREMGLALTLPKDIRGPGRFFGRAKTLLLDSPTQENDWQGIYKALNTYEFIRPGDVIMVENRVPDHAYFGELNARLAKRAGAIGTVVDGVTRDKRDVEALDFPVFARGHYCVDIKFEGTMRAMNQTINIGGVKISNGDYILADPDGVTVIPRALWPEVLKRALMSIEKEWKIGMEVALGTPANAIFDRLGEF